MCKLHVQSLQAAAERLLLPVAALISLVRGRLCLVSGRSWKACKTRPHVSFSLFAPAQSPPACNEVGRAREKQLQKWCFCSVTKSGRRTEPPVQLLTAWGWLEQHIKRSCHFRAVNMLCDPAGHASQQPCRRWGKCYIFKLFLSYPHFFVKQKPQTVRSSVRSRETASAHCLSGEKPIAHPRWHFWVNVGWVSPYSKSAADREDRAFSAAETQTSPPWQDKPSGN